ncbi:maker622 [Drosophila busckii]|uniref:Maker622 n=1 Tax=Drosophila busckii TaxID=30019 RepID=A0A0M4EEE4_DROBS|nr:maker622 [Drosophila busckii]
MRIPGTEPFQVRCISNTTSNGWTLIMRKEIFHFNRTWSEYKHGFGDLNGEFFIGLEKIHLMTKFQPHELLIKLPYDPNHYGYFDNFSIGNETQSYRIDALGAHSGRRSILEGNLHVKFSTLDRDSDEETINCASDYWFGWWYKRCLYSYPLECKAGVTSNFNRTWTAYKQRFYDLIGEFFIGLEKLHLMTKCQPHEIFIQMDYLTGALDLARYSNFLIGNEVESYKLLNYGSYTGSFNFLKNNFNIVEVVLVITILDCKNVNETLQKEVERLKANIREQEINISTLSAKVAADLKLDNFTEASSCLPLGNSNEIQTIRIPGTEPFQVRCISNTTSHGWTLILRKEFGTESFNQPWSEYEHGFGDLSGEFFIGVEKLQLMTKYQPHELLIKLITQSDYDEHHPYYVEHYDKFSFDRLSLIHTVGVHRYFHPILDGISDIKLSAPDRDRNNIYDDIFKCVSKVKFAFGYRLCMDSYPHMKMDLMMRPKILTQNEN